MKLTSVVVNVGRVLTQDVKSGTVHVLPVIVGWPFDEHCVVQ